LLVAPAIVRVQNYPDGFDLNPDVVFPEDDFIVHEAIRDLLLQPGLFWLMSVVWMGCWCLPSVSFGGRSGDLPRSFSCCDTCSPF
jgi:hypothetical protein